MLQIATVPKKSGIAKQILASFGWCLNDAARRKIIAPKHLSDTQYARKSNVRLKREVNAVHMSVYEAMYNAQIKVG